MGLSSFLSCCFSRDPSSPRSTRVCVDVNVSHSDIRTALSLSAEGATILVLTFKTVPDAHHWATRLNGVAKAFVAFPADCDPGTFAQTSLAATVRWTTESSTWEMSQGELLAAACAAFDSSKGQSVALIERSSGVDGWPVAAMKSPRFPDDMCPRRDTASTSFASSAVSPGSMTDSLHESAWDVTLQLEVGPYHAHSSELRSEAGHRVFRWPQEATISPCSVATEVLDWSVALAPSKSPFFPDEMWKCQQHSSSSLPSGASSPRSTAESLWDLTLQTGMVPELTPSFGAALELLPEAAGRSFRWPKEAAISPCSVTTEISHWPATPAQV